MSHRLAKVVSAAALSLALIGTFAPLAAAEEPPAPAVAQAQTVVLSAHEIAALEARQSEAPQLAEFRAGDTTDIVAWSALGVGVAALTLAIILLAM